MLKRVSFLVRKPDLDAAAFRRYWLETHVPLAKAMPGIVRYQVNLLDDVEGRPLSSNGTPIDGYGELTFSDQAALEAAYASPQGRLAAEDLANFASEVLRCTLEEHDIV